MTESSHPLNQCPKCLMEMVLRSAQWYLEEPWLAKDKMVPETFPLLGDHRVEC